MVQGLQSVLSGALTCCMMGSLPAAAAKSLVALMMLPGKRMQWCSLSKADPGAESTVDSLLHRGPHMQEAETMSVLSEYGMYLLEQRCLWRAGVHRSSRETRKGS